MRSSASARHHGREAERADEADKKSRGAGTQDSDDPSAGSQRRPRSARTRPSSIRTRARRPEAASS